MPLDCPKISIVIPTYNAAATVERAISSLVDQNYPDLELILMDGGSQDDTVAIARRYGDHFSHVVSEPDQGQANALNKGFRLATGELWGWLCADDELLPGALHHLVAQFQSKAAPTVVTGGCRRVFDDGTVIVTAPDPKAIDRIAYQNGIEQPSTLWYASLHRAAGELDESLNFAFDWEWWNRLKQVGARFQLIEQPLSNYYFSDSNKTSTGGSELVAEMYQVIKRYGPCRGYLADAYMLLYRQFDLKGCYDQPPVCSARRQRLWQLALKALVKVFGAEYIYCYNWNFASKQQRGLCWFK